MRISGILGLLRLLGILRLLGLFEISRLLGLLGRWVYVRVARVVRVLWVFRGI